MFVPLRLALLGLATLFAAPLSAGVTAKKVSSHQYKVTFTYPHRAGVKAVYLAGSFNSWNATVHPLARSQKTWSISLELPPGKHSYKFVVNYRTWTPDPQNTTTEPDGFGGKNSVVHLDAAPVPTTKVRLGDNRIDAGSVLHSTKHTAPVLYRDETRSLVIFRLRTRAGDVQRVDFVTSSVTHPMKRVLADRRGYDYWEIRRPRQRLRYTFRLTDGRTFTFSRQGLTRRPSSKKFAFVPSKTPFTTPNWVRDAMFYQIFPDRFHNGSKANDPRKTQPWGAKPTYHNFTGGDLDGVVKKIPYLKRLGANGIYFNPIFASPSNNKYDTRDYLKIDPHLGGKRAWRDLVKAMEKEDIRFILDGVFNHSGDQFGPFQDVVKMGRKSRYTNWFFIYKYPVVVKKNPDYAGWWGFGHLPKLNVKNPDTQRYLLKVSRHWLKQGAHGWRLDVPNEVGHWFWKRFRREVKRVDKDAYIVGEIWRSGRPWLDGQQFDAVMNYPFRKAAVECFATESIPVSALWKRLAWQRLTYPTESVEVLYNLLGSHDTPRFLTVCKGDEARAKLAVFLQFTYLGATAVYYGDEVGLTGGKDPANRKCFPWDKDKWNQNLWNHYRRAFHLRKKRIELRRGEVEKILIDDKKGVLVFRRSHQGHVSYVALHRGSGAVKVAIPLSRPDQKRQNPTWKDVWKGRPVQVKGKTLQLRLGPYEGAVIGR